MKNIKEVIKNAAIEDRLFFGFKDKEQLKKIFRILNNIGFKWSSDINLFDANLFDKALNSNYFRICKDGVRFGSRETYLLDNYTEKNIFDFFKELNIVVNDRTKQFDLIGIDCLSTIVTKNGASVRILASDFKYDKAPLVVALSFNGKDEELSLYSDDGIKLYKDEDYNLLLKDETIEFKQVEMTVNEIEKALGVSNLKIVK